MIYRETVSLLKKKEETMPVITSDMKSYVNLIRSGTVFNSVSTVLLELWQNAQRAKAKHVSIDFTESGFTITDDGVGCDDFQNLFTFSRSGWQSCSEAFGQGFFSIFSIADHVEIRSHNKEASFYVEDILDNNLYIEEHPSDCYLDGFQVSLTGSRIKLYVHELKAFAILHIAERSENIKVKINRQSFDYKNPLDDLKVKEGDFYRDFTRDGFTCRISLGSNWCHKNFLYYDDRLVEDHGGDSYLPNYLNTVVIASPGSVTMKAPDRTKVISDDKSYELYSILREEAKKLCIDILKYGKDDVLNDCDFAISSFLSNNEIADFLDVPPEAADVITDKQNKPTHFNLENIVTLTAFANIEKAFKKRASQRNTKEREQGLLRLYIEMLIDSKIPVCWCSKTAASTPDGIEIIEQLKYNGYVVLVANNYLYENVYNKVFKLPHFKKVTKRYEEEMSYENLGPQTPQEERLLELMAYPAHYFGFDKNDITFADIYSSLRDKEQSEELINKHKAQAWGVYDHKRKKIFLSHNWQLEEYDYSSSGPVTLKDMPLILGTSYVICHELTHMLLATPDCSSLFKDIELVAHEYGKCFKV